VTAVAVLAVGGVGFGHAIARGQAPHAGTGLPGAHPASAPVLPTPVDPGSPPVVSGTAASRPAATPAPTTSPDPGSAAPTATPSVSATPSTSPRSTPPARHAPSPPALRIVDTGPACYVEVGRHGHVVVQRILHGKEHLTFRRPGLTVVLGNAGAVQVSIDGHRFHRGGRDGQVRQFRVR
jgi:cytoskeleton protein RodZ